jgi:hypothetical protein
MKRTTLYLDADTKILLKLESVRRKQPMAEIVREAVQSYLKQKSKAKPPGAGESRSRRKDIAENAEEVLGCSSFGRR